jgi:GNAT superfamily N-acetyltransferase
MRIEQADLADLADGRALRACHEVYLAARRTDHPDEPGLTYRTFSGRLTVGWEGDPREVWLAWAGDAAAGWYRLELPDQENRDRAWLELTVRPEQRRRGIGTALLRHAADRARALGRSVISGHAADGSPGEAFIRAAGASPQMADIQRAMDVGKLTQAERARLREPAERAAAGYSLVSWTGPVPDELIGHVAQLYTALNDAPLAPGEAPQTWDAKRVRERINELRPRLGFRVHSVAARHDATGELAALTEMGIDPGEPRWGHVFSTAVTRKHRGHRLGLLVKVAMLDLLAEAEPQLERVVTMNAESNAHMIAVNEALGYTILGPPLTRWQLDVAAALRG